MSSFQSASRSGAYRRRSALGIVAAAATLVLGACTGAHDVSASAAGTGGGAAGGAPATTTTDTATATGPYVALGDSYTSGPWIPEQVGDPVGCQRSSRNYPSLVAEHLRLSTSEVRDVSCAGASTTDLSSPQSTVDGTNPAQMTALSAATALVTLGIGGNDVDFSSVLTRCTAEDLIANAINSATGATLAPCRAYYTSGGADQLAQKISSAATHIAAALTDIRDRAPHARVYVVGYPELLPTGGADCAKTLSITEGDLAYLHGEELALNGMLQQRAQAAGATYVDTYTPSQGHDACAAASTRWIEPWLATFGSAPLHPNALGEQGMADAVLHAIAP